MSHSTSRNRNLATIIIILVIVLAAIFLYQLTAAPKTTESNQAISNVTTTVSPTATPEVTPPTPVKPSGTAEYTNKTFKFTLSHPNQYQVKAYNDRNITIGIITGSGVDENVAGKVGLTVATADSLIDKRGSLQNFMFNKAKLLCDADGGGVSVSCPRQKSIETLSLESGVPAYALTLEQEEKTIGPQASTTKSEVTFYIINIGTDSQRTILIVKTIGDGTDDLTKVVALSAKL